MAIATIDGLEIAYEVIGDGRRVWALTPGGRFSKDYGGVRATAEALAAQRQRVIIWDRPNCGASSVCFTGESESAVQADVLAGLLRELDLGPAVIAGGSGGARVSLLTAVRHPDVASALAVWWISGGVFGNIGLAVTYCGPSIKAAWTDGMEAVANLPEWNEVVTRNPSNRDRFLRLDPHEFISTLERWMSAYCPQAGQLVAGTDDAAVRGLSIPALVLRSGASDPHHTRATSETLAGLIPGADLVEPPWGDREWVERMDAAAKGEALFDRWPLLVPQLVEWSAARLPGE